MESASVVVEELRPGLSRPGYMNKKVRKFKKDNIDT